MKPTPGENTEGRSASARAEEAFQIFFRGRRATKAEPTTPTYKNADNKREGKKKGKREEGGGITARLNAAVMPPTFEYTVKIYSRGLSAASLDKSRLLKRRWDLNGILNYAAGANLITAVDRSSDVCVHTFHGRAEIRGERGSARTRLNPLISKARFHNRAS